MSPNSIGDANRSRVVQALCDHGPLSRADLAKLAGVARATIGNITNGLIEDGLLQEQGPRRNGVGKPARPLWFAPGAGLSVAAALTPGRFEMGLVDARGEVLATESGRFDVEAADQADLVRALTRAYDRLGGPDPDRVLGLGVAVPGVCDTKTGTIVGSGQLPGLRGTRLVSALSRHTGLRVLVDNDARAQALGEKWFGAGRGVATFASLQTGHGLGVGLVLDGVVYRGEQGSTGELGHTTVSLDGERCRCGLTGCWETIASLAWVRAEARRRRLRLPVDVDGGVDAASLAAAGSAAASRLLDDYARNLAVGLANLVQFLNPPLVILHGDAVGGGDGFRGAIEDHIRTRVHPNLRGGVRVVLSELDQRAGLLGAAALVLSETFELAA